MALQSSLSDQLLSPEIRMVFRALGENHVRFVGGCVRNALLGEPIRDIDLATTLFPQNVTDRLSKNGIKSIPTGIDHGTVSAIINGKSFEITTLRIDKKTDGRRAKVEFSDDWEGDARRRDFTMNALYADLDGHVYDPLGVGLADLEKRKVRFVGDPDLRIREDFLRFLRFFRFSLFYGKGKFDRQGYDACGRHAAGLKKLSRERITQELTKIILHPDCPKALDKMRQAKGLASLFGRNFDVVALKRLVDCQAGQAYGEDHLFVTRLLVVSGFGSQVEERIGKWLVLKKKQRALVGVLGSFRINTIRIDTGRVTRWMVEDGRDLALMRLDLCYALGHLSRALHHKFSVQISQDSIPVFPVGAADLMSLGYRGGALGECLRELHRVWTRSGFKGDRQALLGKVIPK
ncbi:MAG: CCA tRNA nucleotidyltransferase [Alphaproteobacteria bacterium]|nr:CCA tRNA nucleotidyltransferase [Alphaproteobacteria bacterium]